MTTPTTSPDATIISGVELDTVVPTAVGELGAIIRVPANATTPLPGAVLVDGSGNGDRFDWGENRFDKGNWPDWIAEAGAVVLRHDKPGCGGSPGHWTDQTLEDRAHEALAAIRVLRSHPAAAGQPVGLYGISQGGWVALLAATVQPESVDFIVCHSGPGTTPAQQERYRIEAWVRAEGHDEATIAEAMAWVDARANRIRRGDPVESVLAEQAEYQHRPWYTTVSSAYDTPANLRFLRGILDFDPTAVMPYVRCPVLALFGGNDTLVPAQTSLQAFAEHLPPDPRGHGYVVFPGADHSLFIADPDPAVPRRDQLPPAYLPTLRAFLADRRFR